MWVRMIRRQRVKKKGKEVGKDNQKTESEKSKIWVR